MGKRAIVLAGGGSRGSYQIGFWRAIRELAIDFQIVTGTSVGSLNGAMMLLDNYEAAEELWERLTTKQILDADLPDVDIFSPKGKIEFARALTKEVVINKGVTVKGLEELLREYVDEERFFASKIDFGLVTVNAQDLKPVMIKKSDMQKDLLCDYLLSSAAFFPAFVPHKIGEVSYIDGGYYDNLPINLACELGATEVIAVELKAPGLVRKIDSEYKKIPVRYIKPRFDLGAVTAFAPRFAQRNIILGYNDTMKSYGKLEGFGFTFAKGEYSAAQKDLLPALQAAFELFSKKDGTALEKISSLFLDILGHNELKDKKNQQENFYLIAYLAGTAFDLDILPVYSLDNYNRELIQKAETDRSLLDKLGSMGIKEKLSMLGEAFKTLGRGSIVVLLEDVLRSVATGETEPIAIQRFLLPLGKEVAAAAYLYAVKELYTQHLSVV